MAEGGEEPARGGEPDGGTLSAASIRKKAIEVGSRVDALQTAMMVGEEPARGGEPDDGTLSTASIRKKAIELGSRVDALQTAMMVSGSPPLLFFIL